MIPRPRGSEIARTALRAFLALLPTSAYMTSVLGKALRTVRVSRARATPADLRDVRRVLVVRLDEIGDVILTTPFLRELRRSLPAASITLIVKPAVRNLVEACPYIDAVQTADWTVDQLDGSGGHPWRLLKLAYHYVWQHYWRALRLARRTLQPQHFDVAIVPRWDVDYYHAAHLAYFSGAPARLGYPADVTPIKKLVNGGNNLLFTQVLPADGVKHEVERSLDIIHELGGTVHDRRLEAWLTSEDKTFASRLLAAHQMSHHQLLVALAPGARDPKRRWPLDHYVALGARLNRETGARLVVLGGPGEEHLGQYLQRHLGDTVINMIGQATLRQTEAVLQHCHLFVGNDTGLMHMAAAVGTPVVEVSCHPKSGRPDHYNSPVRFGPWGVRHTILQPATPSRPCVDGCGARHAHCIATITTDRAYDAAVAMLEQAADTEEPSTHAS